MMSITKTNDKEQRNDVSRLAVGTGKLCQETGVETWELHQQIHGKSWELCL
jgi:hypothetical protein